MDNGELNIVEDIMEWNLNVRFLILYCYLRLFFFVLWDWLLVKSKNSVINGTGLC